MSGSGTVEALTTGADNYDVTLHVSGSETCDPSSVFYTWFSELEANKLSQGTEFCGVLSLSGANHCVAVGKINQTPHNLIVVREESRDRSCVLQ